MVEIAGLNVLLVGEQRRQIVHQAVAAFDAAVSQGRPQLLVLSGGMGWGKTRLVQELYRQLALTRQDRKAPYWPADIVEQTETSLLTRRKHVYPVNPPVSGSQTMPWLWWGLSCALDARRLPLAAVTQGAPQFEVHARGILQRLKVRSLERDIAVDAAGVVFGLLPLPDVVGAVGDAWGLGKQLRERFAAARDASAKGIQNGPRATHRTEATSKSDIVQDLATSLRRLSSRDLPMVVVIDDAHFADPATVALIDSLLREEAHVLIVATAWPDSLRVQALEEQRTPTTERQTFGGWLDAAVEAFPERVSHVALNRLNDDDLGPVVLATAPRTGPEALPALPLSRCRPPCLPR